MSDDERDYAEEAYNRELLRNPDPEPIDSAGRKRALTLYRAHREHSRPIDAIDRAVAAYAEYVARAVAHDYPPYPEDVAAFQAAVRYRELIRDRSHSHYRPGKYLQNDELDARGYWWRFGKRDWRLDRVPA